MGGRQASKIPYLGPATSKDIGTVIRTATGVWAFIFSNFHKCCKKTFLYQSNQLDHLSCVNHYILVFFIAKRGTYTLEFHFKKSKMTIVRLADFLYSYTIQWEKIKIDH